MNSVKHGEGRRRWKRWKRGIKAFSDQEAEDGRVGLRDMRV